MILSCKRSFIERRSFMKTIVIASQKGGSGKTMLAAHLAVEAERTGNTAWLIDTDRQATLSLWHDRRKADTPQRLDVPFARIAVEAEIEFLFPLKARNVQVHDRYSFVSERFGRTQTHVSADDHVLAFRRAIYD